VLEDLKLVRGQRLRENDLADYAPCCQVGPANHSAKTVSNASLKVISLTSCSTSSSTGLRRVTLPSNLQGLYRCDFEGDRIDYDATMKLLKTFSQFR